MMAFTLFSVQHALLILSIFGLVHGSIIDDILGFNRARATTSSTCVATTVTVSRTVTPVASTVTVSRTVTPVASTVTVSRTATLSPSTVTVSRTITPSLSTVTVSRTVTPSPSTVTVSQTITASSIVERVVTSAPATVYVTIALTTQSSSLSSSSSSSSIASSISSSTSPISLTTTAASSVSSSSVISTSSVVTASSLSSSVGSTSSISSTSISSSSVSSSTIASAASGTVALPYATYAASHNQTFDYYRYKNIRYADPPTGSLRFKNPVAPSTKNTTVQDGSYGQTCYQLEQGVNSAAPNQGEDCLFLDVVAPANIPAGTKLPVIVYLYGGGFHSGYKEIYDGSSLVMASNNSVIFVVPNYRVGAFGWLGAFGDVQPGLQDQLFALNWVQSYISLFGGDPTQVTAVGHSAGGGSMVTHMVSNGGEGTVPFQKAVVMSPALPPNSMTKVNARLTSVLAYFGYQDYTQAQMLALPASAINDMTGHIGAPNWGPIIDGDYLREMPGVAFAKGRYHKGLPVITGQLKDEAHNYMPTTSPYIIDGNSDIRDMTYDTKALMTSFFALEGYNLTSEVIDQAWELYPLINNTDIYYTIFGKYDRAYTEILFSCYGTYIANAYDTVYRWYFDVPPAYHAQENPYLFAGGIGSGSTSSYGIDPTLSLYMKTYLVNFVKGDINAASATTTPVIWEPFSTAQQDIELSLTNVGMITDPSVNDRCTLWQTNTQ